MEIYHQYVRLRKQFGRHPKFTDEGAEMFADIRPNEEHAREYIPRNPIITVSQCVPEMSEHDANTEAVILAVKAMNHAEGGWPKDIDCSEAEHTIRCGTAAMRRHAGDHAGHAGPGPPTPFWEHLGPSVQH